MQKTHLPDLFLDLSDADGLSGEGGREVDLASTDTDPTTTGDADDLSQATNIARTMVTRYGMNETLGQVTYDAERRPFLSQTEAYLPSSRSYSEQTAWQIDEAVRDLINKAFDKATAILQSHCKLPDDTAAKLLARETLSADELPELPPFDASAGTPDPDPAIAASVRRSGSS